jgi:ubiquinone/menaquinone biosynthesis C-methylase UbiE
MSAPLSPLLRRLVLAIVVATVLAPGGALLAQRDAADAERLTAALGLEPGTIVAEVGAGAGALTLAVARVVGAEGHVYSNEIDAGRRATIREAAERAGLAHVTVVEGQARQANLPEACCDALFMRNVYHHFAEPGPMAASLLRSLRPGGRLAVIDFAPRGGREARRASDRDAGRTHGVTADTVARELTAAGFEVLSTEAGTADRWFMVVARRP